MELKDTETKENTNRSLKKSFSKSQEKDDVAKEVKEESV